MNTINKITSFTIHTTGEGQRISYTYSKVDVESGTIVSENNRESIVILDEVEENSAVIESIAGIYNFLTNKFGGES